MPLRELSCHRACAQLASAVYRREGTWCPPTIKSMKGLRIIAMGASAGGVEAVSRIVAVLPADLDAAVFVAMHFPSYGTSVLPQILNRAGPLHADHPSTSEPLQRRRIYVRPPHRPLVIGRTTVHLVESALPHDPHHPIDAMFSSAAVAHGSNVIGVVLTGGLDDGADGLLAIKRHGGITIVQQPDDAEYPSMPTSAMQRVAVDHVVVLDEIGPLLLRLVHQPAASESAPPASDPRTTPRV
jgi:two-component system, chemotaxis family, protein-glutamate methylesterase/glutaminase